MKTKLKSGFCEICHYWNEEVIEFKKYWFLKIRICQRCFSQIFRTLKKDK